MIKLYRGDCLGPKGLATLDDKSVDHIITDPPYEAEAHKLRMRTVGSDDRVAVSFDAITSEQRVALAREFVRVSRGWILVFCQAEALYLWKRDLTEAGAKWRRSCLWIKPNAMPKVLGDGPGQWGEAFALAWAGKGQSRWNGGGRLGYFMRNKPSLKHHETEKPVELMRELIMLFTQEGDVVCDPFLGSGTTAVACRETGRSCVGWERKKRYHATACHRVSIARRQNDLWAAAALKLKVKAPKQSELLDG